MAGNQQQPVRYSIHTVKKSMQGSSIATNNSQTRNMEPTSGSFADGRDRSGEHNPSKGNFVPSSNLSQFLLKKGSNGSLHNFENEYSYKINLNNLNQTAAQPKPKKAVHKKNKLFQEVIVEDEAEDVRGSQMGADPNANMVYQHALKKSQGGTNL